MKSFHSLRHFSFPFDYGQMTRPKLLRKNKLGGSYVNGLSYGDPFATRVMQTYKTTHSMKKTARIHEVTKQYISKRAHAEHQKDLAKVGRKPREIERWFLWYCVMTIPVLYIWEMQVLLYMRQKQYFSKSVISRCLANMGTCAHKYLN